jgi:hypothetical protein
MIPLSTAGGKLRSMQEEIMFYGRSDVADGTWHQLILVRSGSTLMSYQDGKLANTKLGVSTVPQANGRNIRFGGTNYLNGQLDDTMLFNYALSAAQIRTLYNVNAAVRFAPLTGSP